MVWGDVGLSEERCGGTRKGGRRRVKERAVKMWSWELEGRGRWAGWM